MVGSSGKPNNPLWSPRNETMDPGKHIERLSHFCGRSTGNTWFLRDVLLHGKISPLRNGMEGFPGPTSSPSNIGLVHPLLDWRLKLFAPWDFVRSHVDRLVRTVDQGRGLKPSFFLLSEVISAKKKY